MALDPESIEPMFSPLLLGEHYAHLDPECPEWKRAKHLSVIDHEFRQLLLNPDLDCLVLRSPPRFGKSSYLARWAPAWYHLTNPYAKSMLCCYGSSLAKTHSRWVRDMVHRLCPLFGLEGISRSSGSASDWQISGTGGGMLAAGVDGSQTGRGANLLIIDDYLRNAADAKVKSKRDKIWDWFQGTISTRLEMGGKMVVLATQWHCLTPDSLVEVEGGVRRIDEIIEGDLVRTSKGFKPVLAKAAKPHKGEVVSITTFGYPRPLRVTPEHRVMTENGWREASEVKVGDWVVLPVSQGDESLLDLFPDEIGPKQSRRTTKRRLTKSEASVDPNEVRRMIDAGMKYCDIASAMSIPGGKHGVYRIADFYGFRAKEANSVPKSIILDKDFWRIVGYWVAEGSIGNGGKTNKHSPVVCIALNVNEQHMIDDIREVMGRYGISVSVSRTGDNGVHVRFSLRQMAKFLTGFGLGAKTKFIPAFMDSLPLEFAREFIRGYIEGDGCRGQRIWMRGASASMGLMVGMRRLMASVGAPGSVMNGRTKEIVKRIAKNKNIARSGLSYEVRMNLANADWMREFGKASGVSNAAVAYATRKGRSGGRFRSKVVGDRLLVQVKSISREEYDGLVYDIQTETGDFVADGMLVHNCDDLIGKLSAKRNELGLRMRFVTLQCLRDLSVPDPLNRKEGEPLWPERFPLEWCERKRKTTGPYVWSAQFQGRPVARLGSMFKIDETHLINKDSVPDCDEYIRFWDRAATDEDEGEGCWTAGVLMGRKGDRYYIIDVLRKRLSAEKVQGLIKATAHADHAEYGEKYKVGFEREGGSSGKQVAGYTIKDLVGFRVVGIGQSGKGDKEHRAEPLAIAIDAKLVFIVNAPWTSDFTDEAGMFPGGKYKDQIDAAASAFLELSNPQGKVRKTVVSTNPIGADAEDRDRFPEFGSLKPCQGCVSIHGLVEVKGKDGKVTKELSRKVRPAFSTDGYCCSCCRDSHQSNSREVKHDRECNGKAADWFASRA